MRLISIQPKCGVCCAWRLGLSGVRASIPALVQLYHPRERYLESLYYLDPSEWLSPQNDWGTVQTGLWILLVSLALLGAAAHRMVLERKLTES